jgi:glycogen(starch) synthase
MRVLLWSDLYWPYIGGAEIFAARLMAALRPRGIDFLVLTSHHDLELPDQDAHDGVPIRRLPFRAALGGRDVKSFAHALRETATIKRAFAPDLIHMNAVGPSALFHLRTRQASDAPFLVTLQQEMLRSQSGGEATLMAQILEAADWIAGCSGAVVGQLRAAFPAAAARSSRIYNGVDAPALAPAPLPDRPHVLCLGRLVPAKGFDVALRAFALLAPRYAGVRFTIAGDGAARAELAALASELGIGGRVAFPGWVDPEDVPRLLNDATVVVMPSRREGLPIVAVQAALMARPVVATAAGGLAEVVLDGETGVVVPPDVPEALAAAIERILSDRAAATSMGERNRDHASTSLDWSRTVTSYHELYRRLERRSPRNAQSH